MLPSSARKQFWVTIGVAVACLSASGCLGFDKEVIVCTCSRDADEVRALLIYEGLCVSGNYESDLTRAKQELTALIKEKDFYLGGRFLHFTLEDPKPDAKPEEKQRQALLQKHISKSNGTFYFDKDKKLCAWQTLTVRQAQMFVNAINESLSSSMLEAAAQSLADPQRGKDSFDKETLQEIQKAARAKYRWLQLEPGRLSFSLPGTPKTFADIKRQALHGLLVEEIERMVDPPKGAEPLTKDAIRGRIKLLNDGIDFLAETAWSIDQRPDRLTISIGAGQGEPLRMILDNHNPHVPRKQEADLIAHAQSIKVEFEPKQTTELLIAEFLKKNAAPR
jgi:hypothetical protein